MIDKEEGYYLNGVVEFKSNSKIDTYTKYASPTFVMLDIRVCYVLKDEIYEI